MFTFSYFRIVYYKYIEDTFINLKYKMKIIICKCQFFQNSFYTFNSGLIENIASVNVCCCRFSIKI